MEVKLYLVSTQDVPTLWGWRIETHPMPRSPLPASTTPDTARPKADSISLLGKERLAHGRPVKMTFISGCKWILGKKWRCRRYKLSQGRPDRHQSVESYTVSYSNDEITFTAYGQNVVCQRGKRIYHFLLKIVKCVVNIGKQNEYL